jgi:hypothetical protein
MKSYKEHLLEVQSQHSVSQSIFYHMDSPPVFLTSTVMKRLNMVVSDVPAFHSTDILSLEGVFKLQGKRGSISTFSHALNPLRMWDGIETSGGIVLELRGDVLLRSHTDAFTKRVTGGRRIVPISAGKYKSEYISMLITLLTDDSAKLWVDRTSTMLQTDLQGLIRDIFKREIPKLNDMYDKYLKSTPDDPVVRGSEMVVMLGVIRDTFLKEKWETLGEMLMSVKKRMKNPQSIDMSDKVFVGPLKNLPRFFGNMLSSMVQQYMDGMEKILSSNEDYRKMLVSTEFITNSSSYDELVMNNFKIVAIATASAKSDFEMDKEFVIEHLKKKMVLSSIRICSSQNKKWWNEFERTKQTLRKQF